MQMWIFIDYLFKIIRRIAMLIIKRRFKSAGKNVIFSPLSVFSYKTISLGNDVFIGRNAHFSAAIASIYIGNKVMFGPGVTIRGGNHNISVVGEFMYDVKTKLSSDDQDVIINDDVWVGANVTILKGVTVGKGSVIAAGAVVTKNVDEYTVVAGVPAKKIKSRFNEFDLNRHKEMLRNKYT